jgi:uracil-DNA glycosylase family 4
MILTDKVYSPAVETALEHLGMPGQYALALYRPLQIRVLSKGDDPNNPDHGIYETMLPGHYIDSPSVPGPSDGKVCSVMLVGKAPTARDERLKSLFNDPVRQDILNALTSGGVDLTTVYVTNAVRFSPPPGVKNMKAAWVAAGKQLLFDEIDLLKPKVIVAMGREAVALLLGKKITLSTARGASDTAYEGTPVVATVNSYAVVVAPENKDGMIADLRRAAAIATGIGVVKTAPVDYRYVYDADTLCAEVDKVNPGWLSIDCEWGSNTRSDYLHGELRTVQFSSRTHESTVVVLRGQNMVDRFKDGPDMATPALKRLLEAPGTRICGHYFRSDQKFLEQLGIDVLPAWENGFDTMLGYHLLKPHADGFGLEILSTRHTDLGRYDGPVYKWMKDNKAASKASLRQHGYGLIPDDLLLPYAAADTDVVLRCVPYLIECLKAEKIATPYMLRGHRMETMYDLYRYMVHPAGIGINEMEKEGLYTDYDRLTNLIDTFSKKKKELEVEFMTAINWPEFNFRSVDHVKELLFGPQPRKGKLSPDGANILYATPLKTSGKPAKDWEAVPQHDKDAGKVSPSTDGETLQILAADYKIAGLLRRLRTVDQAIKNFLCPAEDEDEESGDTDIDVVANYEKGLASCIDEDMRIRTRIGQLTDSGRYTSSGPNLMNQYKKMEAELRKIFATDEQALVATPKWSEMPVDKLKERGLLPHDYFPLRSCFIAPPGYVIVESDYAQAELHVLAYRSRDPHMMEIVADPSRDLHSEMAVNAFKLPCKPSEVKKAYGPQRIMAKAVIFGA